MKRLVLLVPVLPFLFGANDGGTAENETEEVWHEVTLRNGTEATNGEALHVLKNDETSSDETLLQPGESRVFEEHLPRGESRRPVSPRVRPTSHDSSGAAERAAAGTSAC